MKSVVVGIDGKRERERGGERQRRERRGEGVRGETLRRRRCWRRTFTRARFRCRRGTVGGCGREREACDQGRRRSERRSWIRRQMDEEELFSQIQSVFITWSQELSERVPHLFAAQHADKGRPFERSAPGRCAIQRLPRARSFAHLRVQSRGYRIPAPRLADPAQRNNRLLRSRYRGCQGSSEAGNALEGDEVPALVDARAHMLEEGEEVGFVRGGRWRRDDRKKLARVGGPGEDRYPTIVVRRSGLQGR